MSILVEDGDAAEGTAEPLGMVFFKLGVHGLEERADEGSLEKRASNATLVEEVRDYRGALEGRFRFVMVHRRRKSTYSGRRRRTWR